eukprot:1907714-Rhodomonas_salina.1
MSFYCGRFGADVGDAAPRAGSANGVQRGAGFESFEGSVGPGCEPCRRGPAGSRRRGRRLRAPASVCENTTPSQPDTPCRELCRVRLVMPEVQEALGRAAESVETEGETASGPAFNAQIELDVSVSDRVAGVVLALHRVPHKH